MDDASISSHVDLQCQRCQRVVTFTDVQKLAVQCQRSLSSTQKVANTAGACCARTPFMHVEQNVKGLNSYEVVPKMLLYKYSRRLLSMPIDLVYLSHTAAVASLGHVER
jgi:hypothetical protein